MKSKQAINEFYVVGGSLRPSALSYIVRSADKELYERALAGDYCYLLTPRQMGKSSLMARTAEKLKKENVHTAIVDLSQIGTEKKRSSPSEWYYGIAYRIFKELEFKFKLSDWWEEQRRLPTLQRLSEFFRDIVLKNTQERIVIFLDEIDTTISMPFTDDFFAAIRACYNFRAIEPEYQRLSVVLLGVATPTELIKDTQRTPFNIGHRIDLMDFSLDETKPLARGLCNDNKMKELVLERILYWTGGHPYLTQKLFQLVADMKLQIYKTTDIDRQVEIHFLSPKANRQDPNLNFVRARLTNDLRHNKNRLKIYNRIYQGSEIIDEPLSPIHSELKLSGLIIPDKKRKLKVRNRIYKQIFTPKWIKEVMPTNWSRNIVIASMALILISFSFWYSQILPKTHIDEIRSARTDVPTRAYNNLQKIPGFAGKAERLLAEYWDSRALRAEVLEEREESILYRLQAVKVLDTQNRRQEVTRLVGDDYRNLIITHRIKSDIESIGFSPKGNIIYAIGNDYTGYLWRAETGEMLGRPFNHDYDFLGMVFSPDERIVVSFLNDNVQLISTETGNPIKILEIKHDNLNSAAFSQMGRILITSNEDGLIKFWDTEEGSLIRELKIPQGNFDGEGIYILPDGKTVLTINEDKLEYWNAETGEPSGSLVNLDKIFNSEPLAISPDIRKGLFPNKDNGPQIWNLRNGQLEGTLIGQKEGITAAAFSTDGNVLITGSASGTIQIWNLITRNPLEVQWNLDSEVTAIAINPDFKSILTVDRNNNLRLWTIDTTNMPIKSIRRESLITDIAFSPDGKSVITGSDDGTVELLNPKTNKTEHIFKNNGAVKKVAYSSDGRLVLAASQEETRLKVQLWNTETNVLNTTKFELKDIMIDVTFSPDGKSVLMRLRDGLHLLDTVTGKELWQQETLDSVYTINFSPDGKSILIRRRYGLELYDAMTGNELWRQEKVAFVYGETFSPDGKSVLMRLRDGLHLLDAMTGNELWRQENAPYEDRATFSPDGKSVLTKRRDGTLQLWDATTGMPMLEPIIIGGRINQVVFSPDGKTIIAVTRRGIHQAIIEEDEFKHRATRFIKTNISNDYYIDKSGDFVQVAVITSGNTIEFLTIRFDITDINPTQGDPDDLLELWQHKFSLRFDRNGQIVKEIVNPGITKN